MFKKWIKMTIDEKKTAFEEDNDLRINKLS